MPMRKGQWHKVNGKLRKIQKRKLLEEINKNPSPMAAQEQPAQTPAVDINRLQERAHRRGLVDAISVIVRELY
jgi:hypothetical protein